MIAHRIIPKRRAKYRNVPTVVDGIRFASKKEADRYCELKWLELGHKIGGLQLQPRFPLVVLGKKTGTYVADFLYAENGEWIVEDVKGFQTADFKLKWKLAQVIYADRAYTWRLS